MKTMNNTVGTQSETTRPIQDYLGSGEATGMTMDGEYVPVGAKDVVDKAYADANLTGNTSQLEKIVDASHSGWRLLGAIPEYHDKIGPSAVDLSKQSNDIFGQYTNRGATGSYSFAHGINTSASANNSHAQGDSTIAKNENSYAAGKYNTGTSSDTIHETGIGADKDNRANAFEIYSDGRIGMPELPMVDPGISGLLWNNAGVLNISIGGEV